MGGWNPVADVVKTVENVTKEVSKGVENVVTEAGKGVQLSGKVVGNVGNLVGGDVGKVINAGTAPIGAMVEAGGDVIRGDYKGAVARNAGSMLASVSAPVSASTSVRDLAKHDTVNAFFGGMPNDLAEVNDASKRMIQSGEITQQDFSASLRFGTRVAVATGAAIAAPFVATAASPYATTGATSLGTSAAGVGASIGTTVTTVGGAAATKYIGDEISRLTGRQPASEAPTQPVQSSGGSFLPLILVAGIGSLILVFLKRK